MRLGSNQEAMLLALTAHGGFWHVGCGWLYGTPSLTVRVLDSLVGQGLVEAKPFGKYGSFYKVKDEAPF